MRYYMKFYLKGHKKYKQSNFWLSKFTSCLFVCLFVCFDGRPSEAKGSLNWDILMSGGWRFSNAPYPGQAWGKNLVLLPYAGGQA